MPIDPNVIEILSQVRVAEFSMLTRSGGVTTRPLASVWLPERELIGLSTPIAYTQKVANVRRDGRVALLYSDFTGSGLPGDTAVLVQGTATVPDVPVASFEEMADYWRAILPRTPGIVHALADEGYRRAMDWYYWRLPIHVVPERVQVFKATPAGGAWEPPPPSGPSCLRVRDAMGRYPTAVLSGRDATGHPCSARATISISGHADDILVRPSQPYAAEPGTSALLWHRHDGEYGHMSTLLVTGDAAPGGPEWTFTPGTVPGGPAEPRDEASYHAWATASRERSLAYLRRHGLDLPEVPWDVLASLVNPA
ncbi:MAG TPA: pyridoxamine 5'-phosphate oxidase family protein [Thermomonospora sp.]|nr:pyridoxamine 5'-phosphate oxidase family protein [Thermomonospora sp.]